MVTEGRGRLFRRKDGKYLIYVPIALAEDSMFPFKEWKKGRNSRSADKNTIHVKVSFEVGGKPKLVATEWREE